MVLPIAESSCKLDSTARNTPARRTALVPTGLSPLSDARAPSSRSRSCSLQLHRLAWGRDVLSFVIVAHEVHRGTCFSCVSLRGFRFRGFRLGLGSHHA